MIRRALIAVLALSCLAAAGVARAAGGTRWAVLVMPSGQQLNVELAVTPAERALGYMYREHVGDDEGMLFLFEASERHGIWMKNCYVALDLVWLDENFRVIEVVPGQQPCDPKQTCPVAQPLRPARYVLEVAAGNAAHFGLEPGAHVQVASELPTP